MNPFWTRRRFLHTAAAAGSSRVWHPPALWAAAPQDQLPPPRSQKDSPEITSGHAVPLLQSNVARPLRYLPGHGSFTIRNGPEFFNRPLYGPNIPFRVDGGDLPEFSLYLPGHGGNLRLGLLSAAGQSRWLFSCRSIVCTYTEGRLVYELSDPLLGEGAVLRVECLTLGAGFCVQVAAVGLAEGFSLFWAFGGVSGHKGKRNGDIGCEVEPVSQFFQLRPEECQGNRWTLTQAPQGSRSHQLPTAEVQGPRARLRFTAPADSSLQLGEASQWNSGWDALWASSTASPSLPVLLGRTPLAVQPLILAVSVLEGTVLPTLPPASSSSPGDAPAAVSDAFAQRRVALAAVAGRLRSSTPDLFLDGAVSALATAADALWDENQGCVMHGAVAWRMPLAGWRGPYALDATGHHDRMRRHLRHWIAKQDTSAVRNGSGGVAGTHGFQSIEEAIGSPDPGSDGSRSEALLHSDGDLGHNHYDMNLVFFDALLRHLRWTGDLDFARESWPALQRHAAWERRLFRRDFGSGEDTQPLYEAYAAIWASDNLQYNGGGAAHSSAYNLYLNRSLATLAERLGEAPALAAAYRAEADLIAHAMRSQLWMAGRGAFAESREWLGNRRLAENPAVWTMYQVIDSEVCAPLDAWQVAADRLRALRRIPVLGDGVPADAGWQLACSDWQPYVWSLTLLVLAENLATALALFQAGLADEGFALLRGSLLDAGYRGLCPGNFPMSLQLDPHRQESQRDFGDPIGCATRVLVEGLWGIQPDLPAGRLRLRPQLPLAWQQARFAHPEVQLEVDQRAGVDHWRITSSFSRPLRLELELRARSAELPVVLLGGRRITAHFVDDAVGEPRLLLDDLGEGPHWDLELHWRGAAPAPRPPTLHCTRGQSVPWPVHLQSQEVHDPQTCLEGGKAVRLGGSTVFLRQNHGGCRFWLPVELLVAEAPTPPAKLPGTESDFEPVALGPLLTGHVHQILTRGYDQPRSGLCSLGLPTGLLGGWANFDATASISDDGLRNAGGTLHLANGLPFLTPAGSTAPNCCFLSHWAQDSPRAQVALHGHARSLHLLLAGTTFPQATASPHATVTVSYRDGGASTRTELRSPASWWPVEQDYLVDDYLFCLQAADAPEEPLPWRVDLLTGQPRPLLREQLRGKGGRIKGGAAFVVELHLEPERELAGVELRCELYGIVMGLLGITLNRAGRETR